MPCPASAGAAETADGAVERMVLLGLTSRIISHSPALRSPTGRRRVARGFWPQRTQRAQRIFVTYVFSVAKKSATQTAAALYSRLRWILPEMVLGSSSLKTTMRGYL